MKEALFYIKKGKDVQCKLCPRLCIIKPDSLGNCGVRKNINGKLYSLVYGRAAATNIDPIEKKPLYHFLPGSFSFSIGTLGCNLHCKNCQNWGISQAKSGEYPDYELLPEKIVEEAVRNNCKSISYTYNEPTVFYEYVLETAKLAKKKKIRNNLVTNGFINEEPLKKLLPYIDAANVDLKSINNEFYKNVTNAWIKQILNSITLMNKKIWIELTNLIIPTLNDDLTKIREMCEWIKSVNKDIPLHFTAFYPMYKLLNIPPTSQEILLKAYGVAKKVGLNYVYIGNLQTDKNHTFCPKCNKLLIERLGFNVMKNNIRNGRCSCGMKIAGIWK